MAEWESPRKRHREPLGRGNDTGLDAARCTWQQPIYVGSVIIKPGDLVMADIDGALVVPRAKIIDVLNRAEQVERNEDEIKEWVDSGLSAEDIHKRGGYF